MSSAINPQSPADLTPAAPDSAPRSDPRGDAHTRLHGRWLWLARAAWLLIVLVTFGLYLLSIPITYADAQSICTTGQCDPTQLTPNAILELQQLGLSSSFFALYFTFTNVFLVLVCVSVAGVIFWRRSDDWMALLGSLMLVTFGIATFSGSLDNLAAGNPVLQPLNGFINFCGAFSLLLFFYLFPDGHFVPRWLRWLLLLFLAVAIVSTLIPGLPQGENGPWIFVIPLLSILVVQTYRYWKVSGKVERQQTKWVVFGTTFAIGGFLTIILVLSFLNPNGESVRGPTILISIIVNAALNLLLSLIPLSLMIAILRYRLWDIDLLINRTLVYVPLTAILAGIFAASISLTQKLSAALTGQQSDVATVLTTLIVVAAFDPLKHALQQLVDKRFKEAPDPSKKLQAFGAQVQSVVQVLDAQRLTRRLLDEAMSAFGAAGGAVYLGTGDMEHLINSSPGWKGESTLDVPMEDGGESIGRLALGARRGGEAYSVSDRAALQNIANLVAGTIPMIRSGRDDDA